MAKMRFEIKDKRHHNWNFQVGNRTANSFSHPRFYEVAELDNGNKKAFMLSAHQYEIGKRYEADAEIIQNVPVAQPLGSYFADFSTSVVELSAPTIAAASIKSDVIVMVEDQSQDPLNREYNFVSGTIFYVDPAIGNHLPKGDVRKAELRKLFVEHAKISVHTGEQSAVIGKTIIFPELDFNNVFAATGQLVCTDPRTPDMIPGTRAYINRVWGSRRPSNP